MENTPNWDQIKADYLTQKMSVRELAEKHGVSAQKIYRRASNEGWQKLREKTKEKTDEKLVARVARVRAREMELAAGTTEKLMRQLDRLADALEEMPANAMLADLKGVSSYANALNAGIDALTKVYGLQTPAQEAAQKIARQRLTLDRRKQRFAESQAKDGNGPKTVKFVVEVQPEQMQEGDELDG